MMGSSPWESTAMGGGGWWVTVDAFTLHEHPFNGGARGMVAAADWWCCCSLCLVFAVLPFFCRRR